MYLLYPTLCKNAFGMFDCKFIGNTPYLKTDLEEECYVGSHLTAVWTLGVPQLLFYVIGLPCVVLFFLHRNRDHLEDRVVQTRYGLIYSGYKLTRFFWETILTVRKVAVVALSVFGPELGPERQAQVALVILLICIVCEIYGKPFHVVTERHKILAWVETSSLLIEWWTMWSGRMIFQLVQESAVGVVLTISVVVGNIVLFGWAIFKFISQKLYERKAQKFKKGGVKRRSRMDSIDVTSFSNPSLDADTIAKRTTRRNEQNGGGDIELTSNKSKPRPAKLRSKKTPPSRKKKKVSHNPLAVTQRDVEPPSSLPEATELEIKIEIENDANVTSEHNDIDTGRRYSYNNATKETKWLDDEDDIEVLADDNGRRYSYNNKTEVSTWLDKA
jgi:hypothetical protein